jgi:dipeptidyl aminopeptidase/acylaminoacyl peptidase
LHWVSDESGWWRIQREDSIEVPHVDGREYAGPDWAFGQSSYVFLRDGSLVRAAYDRGIRVLEGYVAGAPRFSAYDSLAAVGDDVVCIAASATKPARVARLHRDGTVSVLRESQPQMVESEYVSAPESIEFETTGGRTAHALFYRPKNPDFIGPEGERPPLIVLSHGGPTGATSSSFSLGIQYWTTRGVAVVDVNYGGSTGYGREYRERLKGRWGIVDVDDCVAAATWLAARGEVDERRLVIRGGSAGGYTTLAALTFRPEVFAAGSSHYGVADAEALARDTHKFESRYLDGLIGPYPDAVDVYRERSPIHHTARLSCPLILFQGLEDKVVPPEQSEMMAEALADKGIAHAYVAFEGEQHGFRRADSIVSVAEAELYFLGRVLGFTPADEVTPIKIVHDDTLGVAAG